MKKDPELNINEYLTQIMENLRLFEESNQSAMKNLTVQEVHTIALIGTLGSPKMSDIAERGHVTRGAVSIMIGKLERKGYVKRVRDAKDGRVVHVKLTAAGMAVDRDHRKYHKRVNVRILAALTGSEKRQVEKLMRKIVAALG